MSVQTTSESNTHAPQAETFRRNHPAPLKPRPLKIPAAVETRLANGLRIAIVRDARLPMVSFRLAFRGGDSSDPAELPGLSDMLFGIFEVAIFISLCRFVQLILRPDFANQCATAADADKQSQDCDSADPGWRQSHFG